jgi:hypothetical protein
MKPKKLLTACALLLILSTILLASPSDGRGQSVSSQLPPTPPLSIEKNLQHCTVFYAANEQLALGGNNEDSFNPETNIWFIPPEQGSFGVAYVGYEDFYPQGAINDHGLFYDGLSVRNVSMPEEAGKPIYPGNLIFKAMAECATVECTLKLYDQYSRGPGIWNGQLLIGDATGDSAIIEPLAIIRKTGAYQVATNFFQSEVKPEQRTDDRYRTAMGMFDKADTLSVDLFRDILNATHQEGDVNTLYSTIYDLKQGLIYLYYFHDFDHVVILNLKDELAKGIHYYDIPALFPPSPAALAAAAPFSQEVAKRQPTSKRATVDDRTLAEYAGQYAFAPEQYAWVKSEGGKLFVRDSAGPWIEAVPESDAHFVRVYADADGKVWQKALAFQRDQTGSVTSVVYTDESGNTMTASKVEPPQASKAEPSQASNVEPSQPSPVWPWALAALVVLAIPTIWFIYRKRTKPQ